MSGENFKAVRVKRHLTQQQVARKLGVSQTLVSFWERSIRRPSPSQLAQLSEMGVPFDPLALPMRTVQAPVDFAKELANLGYPGFLHYQSGRPILNPAQLLVCALGEDMLERRVAEALPWVALHYWNMDWAWVRREAKLRDLQNRLGFTLQLAREVAAEKQRPEVAQYLYQIENDLQRSLLVREDTYCNEAMTNSERNWLRQQRSSQASAWNLLSDLSPAVLSHAA